MSRTNVSTPEMQDVLVSVIVPMYNVEPFVEACLNSICSQTHTNLEIICVDDGSPDASGSVARRLAESDGRITVISQPNAGVSRARNTGLRAAAGGFVTFVDADDTVSPEFVAELLQIVLSTNSDFSLSTSVAKTEESMSVRRLRNSVQVWSGETAAENLLYPKIPLGVWNKMFRTEMLRAKAIEFDEGLFMGEGLSFIIRAALNSEKVAATSSRMYFYRTDYSLSATFQVTPEKARNALEAVARLREVVRDRPSSVRRAHRFHEWMTCIYALRAAKAGAVESHIQEWSRRARSLAVLSLLSARVPVRTRLKLLLSIFSPTLLSRIELRRRTS